MTQSAVVFEAAHLPLKLETVPIAGLGDDEVRVAIAACGICGSDLHMAHAPDTFGVKAGAVLGHEFAGTVVAVGKDVHDLVAGDRVAVAPIRGCGQCDRCRAGEPAWCPDMVLIGGGYAQSAVIAARQCRRIADDVALEDAALAEPAAVALHAVNRVQVKPGARVLVLGAGPIGLLVAFWARRSGAATVIVADLQPHQKDRALQIGATHFEISDKDLSARLLAKNIVPDIVFECVGRPGMIDRAVSLVAQRGHVVGVGLCVEPDTWSNFAALHKEVTIHMSAFFDMHEFEAALDALRPAQSKLIQSLVTSRIDLGSVPMSFAALYDRTSQCKVLICMEHLQGMDEE